MPRRPSRRRGAADVPTVAGAARSTDGLGPLVAGSSHGVANEVVRRGPNGEDRLRAWRKVSFGQPVTRSTSRGVAAEVPFHVWKPCACAGASRRAGGGVSRDRTSGSNGGPAGGGGEGGRHCCSVAPRPRRTPTKPSSGLLDAGLPHEPERRRRGPPVLEPVADDRRALV